MRYRTVWISDVHLGTRACKSDLLKSFLKQIEADTIYLVGDIVDGWSLKSSWFWPPEHNDIVRKLLKLSKESKVIYIPGNHDEGVRQFCPLVFGNVDIKTHDIYTTLNGKKLVVLHGDIFDSFVCNLKHIALLGSLAYDAIIWLNNVNHVLSKKLGRPYWSLAGFIKTHAKEAMSAIFKYEMAASAYAKNKGYDGIISGHIHDAAIKTIDGIQYYNDGDWVDSCTALVEDFDGNFKIIDWKLEVVQSLKIE